MQVMFNNHKTYKILQTKLWELGTARDKTPTYPELPLNLEKTRVL